MKNKTDFKEIFFRLKKQFGKSNNVSYCLISKIDFICLGYINIYKRDYYYVVYRVIQNFLRRIDWSSSRRIWDIDW
jgi:hypothetical protein